MMVGDLPRTRKEALRQGSKFYFTGKVCSRGHKVKRYTSVSRCVACAKESTKRWEQRNVAQVRAMRRRWARENPDKVRKYTSRWNQKNPDHYAATQGQSYARKAAPEGYDPFPPDFDLEATIPFYREARRLTEETGIQHHVDHIIPLADFGPHCAENLQVLPEDEHYKKNAEDRVYTDERKDS